MTYKVTYIPSSYNFSVKLSQLNDYKVTVGNKIELMPQNLDELNDVELSGNNYNKYVLMYDSISGKWKDVNPDDVLSAATTELDSNRITTTLPQDFEDQLSIDLDNKIDIDAGTW